MGHSLLGGNRLKKIYTEKDMEEMRARYERSANLQIKAIQNKLYSEAEYFKDATYHNCDLFEQVILFVAVKRAFNFGKNEMTKIGETAVNITASIKLDQENFDNLKEELAEVGFIVDDDLWSFEKEK